MVCNNFVLEKAKSEDLSTIQHILDSCRLPGHDLTKDHLEHFYILKKDSEALGCVGLEIYEEHALLRSLAILERARGEGFGKLLVKRIEEYAREKNIDDIYLLTTTAEAFFSRLGYSTIKRKKFPAAVKKSQEFSSICSNSAVAMVKKTTDLNF